MAITLCRKRQEVEYLADLQLRLLARVPFILRESIKREVVRSAKRRQIHLIVPHKYLGDSALVASKARQLASSLPCTHLRSPGLLNQRT
jgi:hypothetical protein